MLNDDEREPTVVRHGGKELLKSLQTSGGGAYTNDKRQKCLLLA